MAGLINTTPGYLAQMIGQLMIEKAELLAQLDKLQAEATKTEKNDDGLAGDNLHN